MTADRAQRQLLRELEAAQEELQRVRRQLRRRGVALQEAEERLRLATAAHNLGTWDYDLHKNDIVASGRARELLGLPAQQKLAYADYIGRVHPDDRQRVQDVTRRCLEPASDGHCDMEYRVIPGPDGDVRWLRDIRQTYFADGRPVHMIGTFEDVTDRKAAEQANLERLELAERLRRIAEATPGTIFTFRVPPEGDGTPSFPYMGPNARELYGIEPRLLAEDAMHLFSRIPDEDNDRLREVTGLSARTMSMWRAQFRYQHPRKGQVWIESYASPVAQPDGTLLWHGISHDVTTQKQTELELREARRVAEAADRAKSEFLANMSHEIRTPMSAILGYAEILAGQLKDPDNLQNLDTIRSNGLYLLDIIDGILDLSRIEAGKLELDCRRVRPDALVLEVQSLLKLHAVEKGLRLEVEFDGPLPETIETDPTRVKQILINLVENAIKFTAAGAVRITVRLLRDERRLEFDVADTGPGIPEHMQDGLFQPFTQADSSVTRRFGGSGLGLSICRALSRMLGGDVVVDTRIGSGSTFTVTIGTGSLEGVETFQPDLRPPGPQIAVEELRPLSCDVLVVDDRRDMRYLAQHMLEEAGATVALASDGQEALLQVEAAEAGGTPFDVVLLDMQMPVLDGYAAAQALRERGFNRPIIALTANAMKQDERRCLESGCDDYLSKPLSRALLVNTVAYYASDVTRDELAARRTVYGFKRMEAAPVSATRPPDEAAASQPPLRGAPSTPSPQDTGSEGSRHRVLVVDDNQDSCMVLQLLLQSEGCDVRTACTGEEAFAVLEAFTPSIAIVDLGLPDMDGDELVRALKSREELGLCRFICLSGRREKEIDWRAVGFDHFVQKPARFDVLKAFIAGE